MQPAPQVLLRKLLLKGGRSSRLGLAWLALCTGTTLLLIAVLVWWNFNELLHGRGNNDSLGSTFLTISKSVTDQTMGQKDATAFSPAEIADIRKAPQVQDVGELTPAAFKVMAMLGGQLNFYTYLFLESAEDRFMDRKPEYWEWQQGKTTVPIILSKDFLNMYNYVFAPSQRLPQLSENSIKALGFTLYIGDGAEKETYHAQIVGFSDRISSVLVPQSFMTYANSKLAGGLHIAPSRLLVKVADASDDAFVGYLKAHSYSTNEEQLRWNKLRAIVQTIAGATGLLALLLMGISILVFVLFIELTIARAQDAVRLLLQLGYSPAALGRFMYRRFVPLLAAACGVAVLLALAAQAGAAIGGTSLQLSLSYIPGWPLWAIAALCILLLLLLMRNAVNKALNRNLQ